MAYFNNMMDDFYESLNKFGTNPLVLVGLIIVLIVYYLIFLFLGTSNSDTKSFSRSIFETLLFGIIIILIFINGITYFFNINIGTEVKNLFSTEPELIINKKKVTQPTCDISLNIQQEPISEKEAYHIPGNNFTYNDAKAVCKAFDGDIATFNQLRDAQKKGASWCSYGWSNDKLALYPTSEYDWKKLQETSDKKYSCGLPGINGSYLDNPYVKLGANCYGVKPYKSKLESDVLTDDYNIPKSEKEKLFNERVKYFSIGNDKDFEIDQRWIVEHAADRTPFVCQAQSVNIFLPANVHKTDLHRIHWDAWKKGVKSLYYCRKQQVLRGL